MTEYLRSTTAALALCALAGLPALGQDSETPSEHQHHDDDHDHHAHDDDARMDTVIVSTSRSGRVAQDDPMRVETINREEIEEKAIMRPGNIATLVNETGGIRVQVTSPALGAANVRVQGLYGRYTQLLADGLPLYGGQASSLGLLQIPPTDLRRVDVIKGSASSLYGGSALGGVINLLSRRPGDEAEGEILVNATSQNGQDVTSYVAMPVNDSLGLSLTTGAHRQGIEDFDQDGWIDMPGYERVTARPRLFWEDDTGSSIYATLGFMSEDRDGGTRAGRTAPDGQPFVQSQETNRMDGGFIGSTPLTESLTAQIRASAMVQDHEHQFGSVIEDDSHESYLLEATLAGEHDQTNWVLGLAWQSEIYSSDTFPGFDYTYDVPGLFGQVDHELTGDLSVSLSARLDEHSEYGTQVSPRASLLYRPGNWTIRASIAEGYFAPTPFVEEIEAAGLSRLAPLTGLSEESAQTASLDVGYQAGGFETNLTLFASDVEGVTKLAPFASMPGGPLDRVELVNVEGSSELRGSELLLRYIWRDFKITGSYLYLDSSDPDGLGGRHEIALTPEHSAGMVAMWERHGEFRLGLEMYYTGEQRVEDSPFRMRSDSFLDVGLLGEITIGPASWFINAENILNVRQTREEPILLPARAPSGRWTTDIWSRNDGFIVNGGVRLRF
ncbi:MAG: TonB-dependent receptor [Ponticaulis sp.]|nr:TonB-dependent receptor [Ponticaulis sp.]|tara:strand:- start:4589 stop:6598 length:2010 start_codon:yes stop_codon:yes gene_type:complete